MSHMVLSGLVNGYVIIYKIENSVVVEHYIIENNNSMPMSTIT